MFALAGLGLGAQINAAAAEDVSIRFSWKLKGEYAPFYVALDKGYFAKQGLKVKLGEGAGSQAALAGVEAGKETATYAPGIFALQAISKGIKVKIAALYHPAVPMALMSHPSNPVRVPKDLEGKKIGHSQGDTGTSFLGVFCLLNKLDCSKIKKIQLSFKAVVPEFLNKSVDMTTGYLTNDIPVLKSKGVKLVLLDYAKFGLRLPGGSLIVSSKTAKEKPDTVTKMIRAINEGIKFTKANPAAAAKIMKKYWDTTLNDATLIEQIKATTAAATTIAGKPYGWIDPAGFQTSLKLMKQGGKIEKILPDDAYYSNAMNK
jgi:NitT/TauT family transport system substrate-binding protein